MWKYIILTSLYFVPLFSRETTTVEHNELFNISWKINFLARQDGIELNNGTYSPFTEITYDPSEFSFTINLQNRTLKTKIEAMWKRACPCFSDKIKKFTQEAKNRKGNNDYFAPWTEGEAEIHYATVSSYPVPYWYFPLARYHYQSGDEKTFITIKNIREPKYEKTSAASSMHSSEPSRFGSYTIEPQKRGYLWPTKLGWGVLSVATLATAVVVGKVWCWKK